MLLAVRGRLLEATMEAAYLAQQAFMTSNKEPDYVDGDIDTAGQLHRLDLVDIINGCGRLQTSGTEMGLPCPRNLRRIVRSLSCHVRGWKI